MSPEQLVRALDAIDRSDDAGAELADGIERYLAEGGSLDDALHLSGTRRIEFQAARRRLWLRRAAALVDGDGPFSKARELAKEIARFEANSWPRLQYETTPPAGSKLRHCLWHARRTGALPTSERQLVRILRADGEDRHSFSTSAG